MNAIFKRKSIRNFLDKEIEDEKIERLLKAGMQAPSAMNTQPWEFIVVTNEVVARHMTTLEMPFVYRV